MKGKIEFLKKKYMDLLKQSLEMLRENEKSQNDLANSSTKFEHKKEEEILKLWDLFIIISNNNLLNLRT